MKHALSIFALALAPLVASAFTYEFTDVSGVAFGNYFDTHSRLNGKTIRAQDIAYMCEIVNKVKFYSTGSYNATRRQFGKGVPKAEDFTWLRDFFVAENASYRWYGDWLESYTDWSDWRTAEFWYSDSFSDVSWDLDIVKSRIENDKMRPLRRIKTTPTAISFENKTPLKMSVAYGEYYDKLRTYSDLFIAYFPLIHIGPYYDQSGVNLYAEGVRSDTQASFSHYFPCSYRSYEPVPSGAPDFEYCVWYDVGQRGSHDEYACTPTVLRIELGSQFIRRDRVKSVFGYIVAFAWKRTYSDNTETSGVFHRSILALPFHVFADRGFSLVDTYVGHNYLTKLKDALNNVPDATLPSGQTEYSHDNGVAIYGIFACGVVYDESLYHSL